MHIIEIPLGELVFEKSPVCSFVFCMLKLCTCHTHMIFDLTRYTIDFNALITEITGGIFRWTIHLQIRERETKMFERVN